MNTHAESAEARVGGHILEILTRGMYTEPADAIREYVQNGFDAIRTAQRQGLIGSDEGAIEISIVPSSKQLTIKDNGIGLTVGEAPSRLLDVGISRKRIGVDAGFRGIGRLAGVAYCSELVFSTTAKGEDTGTRVEFKCSAINDLVDPNATGDEELVDILRDNATLTNFEVDGSEHFFTVELHSVDEPSGAFLDVSTLSTYLSQYAPVDFDPQRFVFRSKIFDFAKSHEFAVPRVDLLVRDNLGNQQQVFKSYKTNYKTRRSEDIEIRDIEFFEIEGLDGVSVWGWHSTDLMGSLNDRVSSGIRLRSHNIQVGGSAFTGEIFRSTNESYERFNGWYIGEVFLDGDGVIPNGRRDGYEPTAQWLQVREKLALKFNQLAREAYAQSNDRNKSSQKVESEFNKIIDDVQDRLEKGFKSEADRDQLVKKYAKKLENLETAASKFEKKPEQMTAATLFDQAQRKLEQARTSKKFAANQTNSQLDRKQRRLLKLVYEAIDEIVDKKTFRKIQTAIDRKLSGGE